MLTWFPGLFPEIKATNNILPQCIWRTVTVVSFMLGFKEEFESTKSYYNYLHNADSLYCRLQFSLMQFSNQNNLYYTSWITPKRVASLLGLSPIIASGKHSIIKGVMSELIWKAVGKTVPDLTGSTSEPRTSRSRDKRDSSTNDRRVQFSNYILFYFQSHSRKKSKNESWKTNSLLRNFKSFTELILTKYVLDHLKTAVYIKLLVRCLIGIPLKNKRMTWRETGTI